MLEKPSRNIFETFEGSFVVINIALVNLRLQNRLCQVF